VRKVLSGVDLNAIDALATDEGDASDFLTFDPLDGDPSVGAWPTLEVSVGTGEALYRETYL
jgi:hypothetical protein